MPLRKQSLPAPVFHVLNSREIDNPQLVLEELFDFADINDIRALLWEWLKTTVTANYHKELNATERATILTLYEKMEKLVEAAYLINQQGNKHAPTRLSLAGEKPLRHKK